MYKRYIALLMILLFVGCSNSSSTKLPPIANNDRFSVSEGIDNYIDILANDISKDSAIDKSSIEITSSPTNGDVIVNTNGVIIYRTNDINQTQDSFKYQIKDINGNISNEAIVVLDIKQMVKKATNWYIRVLAIDTIDDIKTSDSKFGELEDINISDYSLKLYDNFNQSRLSIIFQDNNQNFKTLFYPHNNRVKEWNFVLNSSNTNADIVLKWQGVYVLDRFIDSYGRKRYKEYRYTKNPIVYDLKLIDKKTSLEVPAIKDGKIYEYRFNMDGDSSREFMWVLSNTQVDTKMIKLKSLKREFKPVVDKEAFRLDSPPMIDKDKL